VGVVTSISHHSHSVNVVLNFVVRTLCIAIVSSIAILLLDTYSGRKFSCCPPLLPAAGQSPGSSWVASAYALLG